MENKDLMALVVGAVLPPLIAVITQMGWTARVKSVVALLVCALAGAGTAYYDGTLSVVDVGRSIMLVIISTQTFYRAFWKPTGIARMVEAVTS